MPGKIQWRRRARPASNAHARAFIVGFLTLAETLPLRAYDCPAERPAHLPPLEEPKDNIDKQKLIVLFRTDFRVSYEVSVDLEIVMERDKVPYNLMLTESADAHLELPFKAIDDIAMSIDQRLSNLSQHFEFISAGLNAR